MAAKSEVDYGELPTVSLAKLVQGEADAAKDLFTACRDVGFFYLDFRDPSTSKILEDVDKLVTITERTFQLPLEEKQYYNTEKLSTLSKTHGYKAAGLASGPFQEKRDGFESYMIANNALFDLDPEMPFEAPSTITGQREMLEQFVAHMHEYGLVILSTLAQALHIRFQESHRNTVPNTSSLGLLRYLTYGSSDKKVGHIAHTDIGTLAIVFSQTGGLQVLMPGVDEWQYIAPKPGHAIVNVGDSLTALSKGALKSCLHRVVPPPDAWNQTKYSIVYLVRPEHDVNFTAGDGKDWRSLDWHNRKFAILRASHAVQREDATLTGRHGYIGLADTPVLQPGIWQQVNYIRIGSKYSSVRYPSSCIQTSVHLVIDKLAVAMASSNDTPEDDSNDFVVPTDWEETNLRHVCDEIPPSIFLICIGELAERFTYRCITAPMRRIICLFLLLKTVTAEHSQKTMWKILATTLYDRELWAGLASCGVLILFVTSFPMSLDKGAGLPGLIVALVLIGLGFGGIKSNVSPLIAEQYSRKPLRTHTLESGEKVIIDPNLTIQTIYGRYYWVINLGALSVIPASWLELKVSFWAAFLLPLCFWALTAGILALARGKYVVQKPSGSILVKAMRVLWLGLKGGRNLDAAKPSLLAQTRSGSTIPWDDEFVQELKRALVACTVFCVLYVVLVDSVHSGGSVAEAHVYSPIFWICYGQTNSNFVSQAASMQTFGIPNDMMGCFGPIFVLTLLPVLEKVVYPTLGRFRINPKPISRITAGFVTMACTIGYTAGIQDYIYKSPPCYDHPLKGACSDGGRLPNDVNVFLQIPAYALTALSELLAFVTGMEYAYTKAPKSMRSIVSSLFLLTCSIGSILGITLSPVSKDPKVLVQYASLSGVMAVTAVCFLFFFQKYDKIEAKMNVLDSGEDSSANAANHRSQTAEKA
ncbi:Peptide transporter PTR2 [Talaromyces islandicus]|uniref:Peptide transporter PTR2 n=1 Tax=Talaromyces islandicus TaxID=28573 RepID=A0A0U1MA12_TALIS|nr:Peptide transporter PTR2 [Talaromyces islandicus]